MRDIFPLVPALLRAGGTAGGPGIHLGLLALPHLAWLFALPIFGAMLPCWRIFGSISAPEGAFTRRNARDMRSISRLAFADALIFPAGMFVLAFMGAGSAPLTIIITPMVIFCCAAVGIVCYVLSRLIGDAAALREENDMTI